VWVGLWALTDASKFPYEYDAKNRPRHVAYDVDMEGKLTAIEGKANGRAKRKDKEGDGCKEPKRKRVKDNVGHARSNNAV
jgi:hypothetical protein